MTVWSPISRPVWIQLINNIIVLVNKQSLNCLIFLHHYKSQCFHWTVPLYSVWNFRRSWFCVPTWFNYFQVACFFGILLESLKNVQKVVKLLLHVLYMQITGSLLFLFGFCYSCCCLYAVNIVLLNCISLLSLFWAVFLVIEMHVYFLCLGRSYRSAIFALVHPSSHMSDLPIPNVCVTLNYKSKVTRAIKCSMNICHHVNVHTWVF